MLKNVLSDERRGREKNKNVTKVFRSKRLTDSPLVTLTQTKLSAARAILLPSDDSNCTRATLPLIFTSSTAPPPDRLEFSK